MLVLALQSSRPFGSPAGARYGRRGFGLDNVVIPSSSLTFGTAARDIARTDASALLSLAGRTRPIESSTADDPRRVRPPYLFPLADCFGLLRGGRVLGDVLGRNTHDLHAGTARDVHGLDDVLILRLRIALHENDLLGTRIVDLLEPGAKAHLVDLLRVDGELPTREHLEYDLIRLRIVRHNLRIGIRQLNIDCLAH